MVSARILLLFGCSASDPPKALDASFWCLTFHSGPPKVSEAHSALNAFQRQHFGIVRGRCFAWFGHDPATVRLFRTCDVIVFDVGHFVAVRHRLWKLLQLLTRSVDNVSALFVVAVSHGLDTNPATVRLFRRRSAKGPRPCCFGDSAIYGDLSLFAKKIQTNWHVFCYQFCVFEVSHQEP